MYDSFDTREQASTAAAGIIATSLRRRLDAHDRASVVLSGGSSPIRTIELLAAAALPWERITVTLSDERWVSPEHEDSNERMVREHLLVDDAAAAGFLSLYAPDETPESQADVLDQALRLLPIPFACSLLGMGEDGHFASLFPDAANLDEGVDVDSTHLAIPVRTAASPHPRISLSLSALSRSDTIVLLIFGEKKLAVFEEAVEQPESFPVGHLLRQKRAPVKVVWAP
jgi:6-phosphogluconolactonase